MTYKCALTQAMESISSKCIFIGYNTLYGRAGGTLANIHESKIFEMPVAENLMSGIGIGMALCGYRPVVYFERFDFILNALDSIINHADKLDEISNGLFSPNVIYRVVVGNSKTGYLYGPTHCQDLTDGIIRMINMPVLMLQSSKHIEEEYHNAVKRNGPSMLIEYMDLYDTEC